MPRRCSSTRRCRSRTSNLSRRFQFALQGYSQTQFFYGQLSSYFYDPALAPFIRREDALATQTVRGGSMFGIYPFSTYRRVELSGGLVHFQEEYADPLLQDEADQYQQENFGTRLFNSGMMVPLGVSFIQETTVFREYGPLSGSTMRLSFEGAPKIGNTLSRQTIDTDARYYMRLGANGVFARARRRLQELGRRAGLHVLRRQLRNARLRIPPVPRPQGVLRQRRASLPADQRDGHAHRHPRRHPRRVLLQHRRRRRSRARPSRSGRASRETYPGTKQTAGRHHRRPAQRIEGFRLVDSRASYGIGLETFALGFPVHFDWSYRTLFNKAGRDYLFGQGGSAEFRKARFAAWIGYDF